MVSSQISLRNPTRNFLAAALAGGAFLVSASFAGGEESPAPLKPAAKVEGVASVPFVPSYNVTYIERDGKPLKCDVYVPRGDGPFPAVLLVHGGAWVTGNKSNCFFHGKYLAERGYTAVCINYRLAPTSKFPAQIEDCRAAVRWMRREAAKYKIDPERIGGYGYSAGGHLVSLLAAADANAVWKCDEVAKDAPSCRLQAVAAGGAPVDFTALPVNADNMSFFLGGSRAKVPEIYRLASPLSHVSRDDPPFFFFHGENDLLVPKAGVERMHAKLKEAGVDAELKIVEGAEHLGAFLSPKALAAAADFFDRTLKTTKKK